MGAAFERAEPSTARGSLFEGPSNRAGHVFSGSFPALERCAGTSSRRDQVLNQTCLARIGAGYTHAVYQPASRFWEFQGIEFALFGGLALLLIAFAAWRVLAHGLEHNRRMAEDFMPLARLGPHRVLGREREAGRLLLRARDGLHAHRVRRAGDGSARPRLVRPRAGRHPLRPYDGAAGGSRDHAAPREARRRRPRHRAHCPRRDAGVPRGRRARRAQRVEPHARGRVRLDRALGDRDVRRHDPLVRQPQRLRRPVPARLRLALGERPPRRGRRPPRRRPRRRQRRAREDGRLGRVLRDASSG